MFTRIQAWFKQIPLRDPVQWRQAMWLQLLLLTLIAAVGIAMVANIFVFGPEQLSLERNAPNLLVALAALFTLWLLRRGAFYVSASILIGTLLLGTTQALLETGISGSASSGLALILSVLVSGLLLPRAGLILVTVLCFAIMSGVGWLELTGRLVPTPLSPIQRVESAMLLFALGAGLMGLLLDQFAAALRKALLDSQAHAEALRREREHLQVTLSSIGDAVISTDNQGRITFVNPVAEKMTGWTNREAMGQQLTRIFHIVNEATRAPVENPVEKVIREGVVVGLANHTVLIAKDGHETPIDDSGAPIRDPEGTIIGVVLVFRNISDRKEHERYVSRLQDITSALSEAITPEDAARVVADAANRLLGAYQTALMVLNKERGVLEFLNKEDVVLGLRERYPEIPLDYASPISDAARTNQPIWINTLGDFLERYPHLEDVIRNTTKTRSTAAIPLVARKEVIGGLAVSFAHEHHMTVEEREFLLALGREAALTLERATLYVAEREARQRAEEANALKLKFLAMISHELRTPLTSIKGFISTLLTEDIEWDAANQREFMIIIDQESDNLANLVEQLLDLSRLEAGTLAIKQQRQPLQAALTIAIPRIEMISAGHHLEFDLPDDLPEAVFDAQRIAQVLTNLVHNACKYSPAGTTVRISAEAQPTAIQVNVIDEGIGIPQADRETVFEAFRQAGNRPPTETKGAGLGLAISKALVEAHQGRIWIQSHIGTGTTISFTLPRA